jgi:hypothetical protein
MTCPGLPTTAERRAEPCPRELRPGFGLCDEHLTALERRIYGFPDPVRVERLSERWPERPRRAA